MRTTLNLDDALVIRAKQVAASERTTLTRLIEEGLRMRLRQTEVSDRKPGAIPVFAGQGGLLPGIDSLRSQSLTEAADQADRELGKVS